MSDTHELKKKMAATAQGRQKAVAKVDEETKGILDLSETETKTRHHHNYSYGSGCWAQISFIIKIFCCRSDIVLNWIHLNLCVISAAFGSICAISSDPEFCVCFALFIAACGAAIFFNESVAAVASGVVILLTSVRTMWNYLPNKEAKNIKAKEEGEEGTGKLAVIDQSALRIQDILVNIMSYQTLEDRARLRAVSRSASKAYHRPCLWIDTLVPDSCGSINLAVKAIPKSLSSLYPKFIPKIRVRADMTYYEGDSRGLSVLFKRRPSGIYVDKPVIIEAFMMMKKKEELVDEKKEHEVVASEMKDPAGKQTVAATLSSSSSSSSSSSCVRIHSSAGEAITVSKNARGAQLIGIDVYINRFSSHGIAVYADNVKIKNCRISAQGTNACGVLVAGRSVSSLESCEITDCGGSGVLLAYNAGVHVEHCSIKNNQWSGIGAFAGSSLSIQDTCIENNALFAVGAAVDVTCNLSSGNTFQGNGRGDSVHRYLAYEHS